MEPIDPPKDEKTDSTTVDGRIPLDYPEFVRLLRQREAAPLTFKLKSFLNNFSLQKRTIQQQRKLVAAFLSNIYEDTINHPLFESFTDEADLEQILEGWEKLLLTKIYDIVFAGVGPDEVKMNVHLQLKIDAYSWIQESHLDLPFTLEKSLEVGQNELKRINSFRAPRDKLTILQNTLQLVVELIEKNNSKASSDHLLPVLILTIIRANPPNLISNVKYVMRFRNAQQLERGPTQYCLTNMMSAVSFIYNVTLNALTLTDEEREIYGPELGTPVLPPGGFPKSRTPVPSDGPKPAEEIGEIAQKVMASTSEFLGTLFKEARTLGENAVGTMDNVFRNVGGDQNKPASTSGSLDVPVNNRPRYERIESERNSMYSTTPPNVGGVLNEDAAARELETSFDEEAAAAAGAVEEKKPGVVTPRVVSPVRSRGTAGAAAAARPFSVLEVAEQMSIAEEEERRRRVAADEEEYEFQLAMALSMSEAEAKSNATSKTGEDSEVKSATDEDQSNGKQDEKLVDTGDGS
ncbi:hypothetical protein BJ742DRAFT_810042 [Cladochytrium replicatum]|nr:hypothetical protein BJ742DRAFT_810042 [Cladochytrium replicatum]